MQSATEVPAQKSPAPAKTTREIVDAVFVEVANGRGSHGSFLCAFAAAWCRADAGNKVILQPAAIELIAKYELASYAEVSRG